MADLTAFIAVFALGLSASFYPCLFPLLPSFVAYLAHAHEKWWRGAVAGGLVTVGIMTVFVTLGLVFSRIIDEISPYYNEFRFLQGILLILLGMLLIANITINIGIAHSASSAAHGFLDKFSNEWAKSYFIGFSFAALAAPCAIIVFLTLFTLTASESTLGVIMLMIVFSIGAGIPFLAMGILVPEMKESLSQFDVQKIRALMPRIAGMLVILVGVFLVLESLQII
ncbi:MAG: cytochrome c biogenesis CcdA family protein [Candidatus Heimdallarchaeota archaeon]